MTGGGRRRGRSERRNGEDKRSGKGELLVSYTAAIRFDWAKTVACRSEHSFEEFTHLCKNLGITDHNNPILGSRESHVESTSVIQEPDPLVLVGTYTGEDDVIFLTSLEGIHTCHFKLLEREGQR